MITLDWIIEQVVSDAYFYSQHADEERKSDNLLISEIEEALLSGTILESYPDDPRGNSCLVVGFTKRGKPLHIVCGQSGDALVIITVYIPSPPKFITPYQRSN